MSVRQSLYDRAHRWARWWGGREPAVLAAMFVIFAALWAFIALAGEVMEGDTTKFDERVVLAMRRADDPKTPIGPPWVAEMGRDATALGGFGWLIFFTVVVASYLHLDRKQHLAWFVVASAVSGYVVSSLLKLGFQRERPDIVPHLSYVYNSTSFPSGHSMNSAVIYLTLGVLVAAGMGRKRLKVYVVCVAILVTLAVGVSRVFLGVHYPTDVLAGWMAGTIWAMLCWIVARKLQRRGRVETPDNPDEEHSSDKSPAPLDV